MFDGIRIKGGGENFYPVVRTGGSGSYRVESRCCSSDLEFKCFFISDLISRGIGLVIDIL